MVTQGRAARALLALDNLEDACLVLMCAPTSTAMHSQCGPIEELLLVRLVRSTYSTSAW
jgi:hypothetical protein